ncbi:MAG: GWxTD domain-containing protein [Cyclobacteriaceae bacterium]
MKHIKKGTLVFILVTSQFWSQALDLTKLNLGYQYSINADIMMDFRVISDGDWWNVYSEVRTESLAQWSTVLLLQNSYDAKEHDTLSIMEVDTFLMEDNRRVLRYAFPKKTPGKVLIFSFTNLNQGVYRFFDVSLSPYSVYSSFCPLDKNGLPILRSYILDQGIKFPPNNNYHVYKYKENFGPADPPMGAVKELAPTLAVDSSYYVGDSLAFENTEQMYLIQKDTTEASGLTVLNVPYYFPEMRRIKDLIPPLQYITTALEFNSLSKSADPKKNFETFWIRTYGTKFRAKQAIKAYYDRVEEANLLFTDYKMGWKTDRGIIYIVYGAPNVVIKTERNEIWKYPEVEYEFVKISTLFAPETYSVKRNKKYEKDWYRQVGLIREGNG